MSDVTDAEPTASPAILPFVTEAAYAEWAGLTQRELYGAEVVSGGPALVFPEPEPGFHDRGPFSYAFPAITVTMLPNAVVRGKANVVQPPEAFLRHGLSSLEREILPEEANTRLMPLGVGCATWGPFDASQIFYLPEGAAFTDGVAANYAHWMTEVLPRIAAFMSDPVHAAIPLILDAGLHPNIMRSVELVAGPGAVIQLLSPEQTLLVGVLHNVSPAGYVPYKLQPQAAEEICQGLFSGQALRATVAALKRAVPGAGGAEDRPKLFIRRNSAVRHMANEAQIADAMAGLGFTTIEPDRLTLDEQILAYSNAAMVVGATGAAITNVIFTRPDCPTVVLMPAFAYTAWWYWRRMSAAVGAGPVVHVAGPQTEPLDDPFDPMAAQQDFQVEVADVLAAVGAAEALRG